MLSFWIKAQDKLQSGCRLFLALVVDHSKGSPGTKQAALLVSDDDEHFGTIGGGAMELDLLDEAKRLLALDSFKPHLETLMHRSTEDGNASGLYCGGSQTLLKIILRQGNLPVVKEVVNCLEKDKTGSLIFSPTGVQLTEENLSKPSISSVSGENWMVEWGLLNRKRVLVVGCGHCGSALAKQMDLLGYHVVVNEPREDLNTVQELSSRTVVRSFPYDKAGSGIEHAALTFALVMTPSYPDDVDALSSLLSLPFPYIGVMGSSAKLNLIKKALLAKGHSDSDWSRIIAPAGLAIDSDTPQEIAVSVAAQILNEMP
tara:strand:- start:38 stop:982 length:945 start_codon:yes stop_codon:yes gene_type:complete